MGWNDHIDFDYLEFVQQAVDEGELEEGTAAYGVAQLVGHEGEENLSLKQRNVYENVVGPAIARVVKQNEITQKMNMAE